MLPQFIVVLDYASVIISSSHDSMRIALADSIGMQSFQQQQQQQHQQHQASATAAAAQPNFWIRSSPPRPPNHINERAHSDRPSCVSISTLRNLEGCSGLRRYGTAPRRRWHAGAPRSPTAGREFNWLRSAGAWRVAWRMRACSCTAYQKKTGQFIMNVNMHLPLQ